MKKTLLSLAVSAIAAVASATVVTYAAPEQWNEAPFSVRVSEPGGKWMPVGVRPVKIARADGPRRHVETASMGWLDFDSDSLMVEVTFHGAPVDSARVRPLSYKIVPAVADSVIKFTIARPMNLSVEVNGDIFHNLHLFANPIDPNRPKKGKSGKNYIYFGPGVHTLDGDSMLIPSGTTVYVDGAARVDGSLIVADARDVRILGRGEVHPKERGEGVYVKRSRNVEIDGLMVTQCPVGQSDSVRITNVKSLSSYGWGDGLNVFASSNVSYDNCFCRNSDDCSTVYATRKGFVGGCRNILMENSSLWADVAHPIMIGLHGNPASPDTIENVTYRNIDVLDHCEMQLDYQGCMTISCGDDNLVRDVTFDNIRVEDFRQGQLLNIRIFFNKKYCQSPGRGVHNVLFRDIDYHGDNDEISIIAGYDDERTVDGVRFENLRVNGVVISDDMPGKPGYYKTSDMARIFVGEHVGPITFTR